MMPLIPVLLVSSMTMMTTYDGNNQTVGNCQNSVERIPITPAFLLPAFQALHHPSDSHHRPAGDSLRLVRYGGLCADASTGVDGCLVQPLLHGLVRAPYVVRSEEHTSELQSRENLV